MGAMASDGAGPFPSKSDVLLAGSSEGGGA